MSYTIRITITDHETQNNVTRVAFSERDDWTWMLNEFANAVNGAGFAVDPSTLFYGEYDASDLAFNRPFEIYSGKCEGTD